MGKRNFAQSNIAGALTLTCCALFAGNPADVPQIEADFAWRMAERAVAEGPRVSGSEGARRTVFRMKEEAEKYPRFRSRIMEFPEEICTGEKITFRNLVVEIPGRSGKFVLVGAHYDTKYLPDAPREFVGANDGASGAAALLAMIRAIDRSGGIPPIGIRFVFFDGEECRVEYARNDGLHGSRYEAAQLERNGMLRDCRAMLLLDMVGDRELSITFPAGCDAALREMAREEAAKLGVQRFFGDYSGDILDDDFPFRARGIPTLNFIDFQYGPENRYWHTPEDTLDKLSRESLKTVADVVLALIWRLGEEQAHR